MPGRTRSRLKPLPEGRPIPKKMAQALIERPQGIDSEQLLRDIIDVWGGPRAFAVDLNREFKSPTATPMSRQRILEMIQRLVVNNTKDDIATARKPSEMSREDLEETLSHYLVRLSLPDSDPESDDGRQEPSTNPVASTAGTRPGTEEEAEGQEDGPRDATASDDGRDDSAAAGS